MKVLPLDLNFQNAPHSIAAYLVVGSEGPVLVETGPASTIPVLKSRLAEHGYAPADIRHVLVTHIHLDHAGAAGWWALQGAQVYVHHAGVPHLIDPFRLLSSARRIYGDDMERLWGETVPAPAAQVHALRDGDAINVNGLTFVALDTPGHANHHHTYRLGDIAFTGDATAVRLPGSAFTSLPAPPPEFDLPAWQRTIKRLLDEELITIYPTHFGPLDGVDEHLEALASLIDRSTEFVRVRMEVGIEPDALIEEYQAWVAKRAASQGVNDGDFQVYELTNPSFMSVIGITRYWRKHAQS